MMHSLATAHRAPTGPDPFRSRRWALLLVPLLALVGPARADRELGRRVRDEALRSGNPRVQDAVWVLKSRGLTDTFAFSEDVLESDPEVWDAVTILQAEAFFPIPLEFDLTEEDVAQIAAETREGEPFEIPEILDRSTLADEGVEPPPLVPEDEISAPGEPGDEPRGPSMPFTTMFLRGFRPAPVRTVPRTTARPVRTVRRVPANRVVYRVPVVGAQGAAYSAVAYMARRFPHWPRAIIQSVERSGGQYVVRMMPVNKGGMVGLVSYRFTINARTGAVTGMR